MARFSLALVSAPLLACLSLADAYQDAPTAIRKLPPDSNEKLFPEHLAFAPLPFFGVAASVDGHDQGNLSTILHHPPFSKHYVETEENRWRQAFESLSLLKKRSSCPAGFTTCGNGSPSKCCQQGTYCTDVSDDSVGNVACCPEGSNCSGGVGKCPADAVTCPASLGGGCCIAGYECKGIGCVPAGAANPGTVTQTRIESKTKNHGPQTITKIKTTIVEDGPSTVLVTLTVTKTSSEQPRTRTTVVTKGGAGQSSATGGAPYRPISSSSVTSPPSSSKASTSQDGCPTGFYGCQANHGGGCCQTDRDCQTHSCPAPSSTTIVSDGATIVVPATGIPAAATTAKCANGWFMCGKAAGPVAGCCPSGYDCGTASCFKPEASQTGQVKKKLPGTSSGPGRPKVQEWAWFGITVSCLLALL